MTPRQYLRVLREHWTTAVAVVLLTVAAAGALAAVRPPAYTATLTTYVSARPSAAEDSAYQGGLLSQQRVTSYVELVRSERVARTVIEDLRLSETPSALASRISSTSVPESVLIGIAVEDRSPVRAAELANAVGQAFIALVDDLERPTGGGEAEISVRVVDPAEPPGAPSGAGPAVYLAVGLLLGLGLGVAAAMARHGLDTSVKSVEQLAAVARAPVLGTVALDPRVRDRPLAVRDSPRSPEAEAYRHLRTNLRYIRVGSACKVIVVTSSVVGEGKTTTVCNLAISLGSAGNKVLVVDADLRRPKVAELLGLEGAVGLTTVLSGRVPVGSAIQRWSGGDVDVLASGPLPPNPSELLASAEMEALLREVRETYQYVLVDSPPLLPVTDAAVLAPATDGAILVCRYRRTRTAQVTAARDALETISASLLGTVFTMAPQAAAPPPYTQVGADRSDEVPERAAPVRPAEFAAIPPVEPAPPTWAVVPAVPDTPVRDVRPPTRVRSVEPAPPARPPEPAADPPTVPVPVVTGLVPAPRERPARHRPSTERSSSPRAAPAPNRHVAKNGAPTPRTNGRAIPHRIP
ncbi:polysaccharide biosynthesis tyrosine autokinase [Pseudonocardia oceani]|uniref:non-specific protein-tyrosine kinase n=5 Tax=Pseudonocardia oceani TaxID=2792013 RepID=A0ABS6U743_9PSEU|nr:polysaccharide biosynthesis tyrosine autokinase [Pseudonocardia oceani]MBW0127724.1 polysaccharide biosynthesis tyrosine autokinase [Pseudonocardia oceani]